MSKTILVLSPVPGAGDTDTHEHRTLKDLKGKTVGFIDNSKPNFNFLAEDLSELLTAKYGVKAVITRRKPIATMPASDQYIRELTEECDLVITGSGD
jgi:hypothetical protein